MESSKYSYQENTASEPDQVLRASGSTIEIVIDIIAEAFDADPVMNWVVRQDSGRGMAIRLLTAFNAHNVYLPRNETWLTACHRGAALWLPPAVPKPTLLSRLPMLPAALKATGELKRMRRAIEVAGVLAEFHPKKPHYYLCMVGVRASARGRGLASALIRAVTERCDIQQCPAYLENTNAQNLSLYRSHGFRELSEQRMPRGGPSFWPMWREPVVR